MWMDYVDTHYSRTATPGGARPPLAGDLETEVCVVGGGLAGLATALGLRERGREVVLLEARRVGWGASGRNGGFVGPGFSLSLNRLIRRVGMDAARELYELSRDGVRLIRKRIDENAMDCGPIVDGSLSASWFDDSDAMLRARDFMAENFDEHYEFWPRERLRQVVHTERYHHALFRPKNFQFHPLNFSRGIASAAQSMGVQIFEQSPVCELELDGNEKVVHTDTGKVRAKTVVMTCGGYLDGLQRRLAAAMVPVATFVIATEPLGDNRLRSAIQVPYSISDNRFASDYYRALDDTRILWGGRISVFPSKPRDVSRFMLADLLKVYPQLEGIRVESAWNGVMSYAAHKMPQIGMLSPGTWYAMGFGGHGMNTTSMAGELLASAIAEGDDRYRLFAPFGLTPTGGSVGAAAAQITYWYYQLRDRLRT